MFFVWGILLAIGDCQEQRANREYYNGVDAAMNHSVRDPTSSLVLKNITTILREMCQLLNICNQLAPPPVYSIDAMSVFPTSPLSP